jgi:hypothetical protein
LVTLLRPPCSRRVCSTTARAARTAAISSPRPPSHPAPTAAYTRGENFHWQIRTELLRWTGCGLIGFALSRNEFIDATGRSRRKLYGLKPPTTFRPGLSEPLLCPFSRTRTRAAAPSSSGSPARLSPRPRAGGGGHSLIHRTDARQRPRTALPSLS